jgi:hypothetical protein
MTAPVTVSISIKDITGTALARARVMFERTAADVDGAVIAPRATTATCDADGVGSASLLPNTTGSQGTQTRVTIVDENGDLQFSGVATIPETDCNLHAVLNLTAPAGVDDAQQAALDAQAAQALAKQWATKTDGEVVAGEGYGAKKYAQDAAADADAAQAVIDDPSFVAVSAITGDITTVAGVAGEVSTVAGIAADVTTVAGAAADVSTVAAASSDVGAVAGSIAAVSSAADNMAAIVAAPTHAQTATTKAGEAADSAAAAQKLSGTSHSANYTTVLGDANTLLLHPSTDASARTFTIDSHANVAYPDYTTLMFVNDNGAGVLSIAVTSDTMYLVGSGLTGTRTLAANGMATAIWLPTGNWVISGVGLS